MMGFVKKAGLGVALAVTALATVPADAQRYGGWHHDRDGGAGTAVVAGIAGLAIGAAIASDHHRGRDDYYRGRGYEPDYGYSGYYRGDEGYRGYDGYRGGYYGYEAPRCWTQFRWDPYYGRDVRVRVCR